MRIGKDALTWSFVKLFGLHVRCDLHEFEKFPASHAWRWKTAGLWRTRLLTKAQCCGVIVSIMERSDRVELLVDDGTELVKAVLWREGAQAQVTLGDLVHVEGKLNVDKSWDAVEQSRELRILRISKVEDPNEEFLHWTQVVELEQACYSAGEKSFSASAGAGSDAQGGTHWENIAREAFFRLTIDPSRKQEFLGRRDRDRHGDMLLETLESILNKQKTSSTTEAADVVFSDLMAREDYDAVTNGNNGAVNKKLRIRALQYVFRMLRRAGLLFLEDDQADRHILLSFEAVLKPALLQFLRDHPGGLSVPEIADAIMIQERFKCIPLQWIETSLGHLFTSQLVVQRDEPHLFFLK
ncbi:uncharacterized protein PITG_21018 [Phytophthora infestans T30-4]|uniref:CST complex subunit STN1 n=1 Tax=Phytophthora infestans (strain T30-4) TaxID=403677 RepID=D0P2X3_PHYIT|nr:uncharacterized protein PITG_21018 [Phytophthora infestans T30-4]EEY58493.1 expressed protein [Phytophthora infestans T30-4]|eukprot:XP_002895352.1 expressed protein [Phytophthora infestans T30-4]